MYNQEQEEKNVPDSYDSTSKSSNLKRKTMIIWLSVRDNIECEIYNEKKELNTNKRNAKFIFHVLPTPLIQFGQVSPNLVSILYIHNLVNSVEKIVKPNWINRMFTPTNCWWIMFPLAFQHSWPKQWWTWKTYPSLQIEQVKRSRPSTAVEQHVHKFLRFSWLLYTWNDLSRVYFNCTTSVESLRIIKKE